MSTRASFRPRNYRGRGRGSAFTAQSGRNNRSSSHRSSRQTSTRSTQSASSAARPARTRLREHATTQTRLNTAQLPSDALPEREQPDSQLEDLDHLNETVMAVDLSGNHTVGCCYYVAREERLYFMEDVKFGGLDVADNLRLFVEPTVVIVSNRIDDTLLDKFDPEARSSRAESESNDQFRLPFLLEVRPSNEFAYEAAKSKLANLSLADDNGPQISFVIPGDVVRGEDDDEAATGRQAQLLRLAGWVNVESRLSVGCAGALLTYLQRRRAIAYLPGDASAQAMFRVAAVQMFSLRDTMFINADTLHSLQILESESHPNSQNQGPTQASSGSKEGLSVYGLFRNLAGTSHGKSLLRQYFLRPSLNINIINERLDTIAAFSRPENDATVASLTQDLRPVKNMRVILTNLRKGVGSGMDKNARRGAALTKSVWANIREFVFRALKIKEALQTMIGGEELTIKRKVLEHFVSTHLCQLGKRVNDIVDFELSMEEGRTIIRTGIDEELDHMKQTFDGFGDLLAQVEQKLSETLPAELQQALSVIYFPQIGFLTTVPFDSEANEPVYDGGLERPWERMFATEYGQYMDQSVHCQLSVSREQVYFKNDEMREMDDHFGDLYGIISDREIEICHELAQYVLGHDELLTTTSDICGELDSFLALTRGAKIYNLCKPRMTRGNEINVVGGRHILQELTVASFVANDTSIVGGSGDRSEESSSSLQSDSVRGDGTTHDNRASMLILTGPNYSGKSVFLKQVALIVFMAHVGCFVPARSAKIGLTDKILSRVTTRESVSRIQSTFMIDLQQISLALNLATRRSLLVIDEFGKGTDSNDGAGLACAVLEYLISLGSQCPKVLAATHFHEIFENGLFVPRPMVAFGHMEVRMDTEVQNIEDQITHLYNFRNGRSNSSFGTWCAAANGVPEEIVQRALDLVVIAAKGDDLVAACSFMPVSESAELEEAERIARDFLKSDIHHIPDPEQTLSDILAISGSSLLES